MRRFTMTWHNGKTPEGQYEGVEFGDGQVALRCTNPDPPDPDGRPHDRIYTWDSMELLKTSNTMWKFNVELSWID